MKIVMMSDTHGLHRQMTSPIPEGDIMIHAGDCMNTGHNMLELIDFLNWYTSMSCHRLILIAGNHDWAFQKQSTVARGLCREYGVIYLEDSGCEIDGVRFYGSPWQPEFNDWAFNLPRGNALREKWALIPQDTDVLITHGPAFGLADMTPSGTHVGCEELRERVYLERPPNLRLHVFGHIHHSYQEYVWAGIHGYNVSICTERYQPTNAPMVFEW